MSLDYLEQDGLDLFEGFPHLNLEVLKKASTDLTESLQVQEGVTADKLPFGIENPDLEKLIEKAGYGYDEIQDIFYSTMNPWQRGMGYTRLYDEAAAPLSMIMDCEPIHFDYNGEKWMISLWKGQYGMVTGGEIGVYQGGYEVNIPGIYTGIFYKCVSDENMLLMSYTLMKNGKILFRREDKHWWLTGFALGEFSEPWELTMDVSITLKDQVMRDAFLKGLLEVGYTAERITVQGNTVGLLYEKPFSRQPFTRTILTDWAVQRKNQMFCEKYQELTKEYLTMPEKFKAVEEKAPQMFKSMLRFGKSKPSFEVYESVLTLILMIVSMITTKFTKKSDNKETAQINPEILLLAQALYPRIWTLS